MSKTGHEFVGDCPHTVLGIECASDGLECYCGFCGHHWVRLGERRRSLAWAAWHGKPPPAPTVNQFVWKPSRLGLLVLGFLLAWAGGVAALAVAWRFAP